MLSPEEANHIDLDDSIQLLEFCKHGDLMSLLERIDEKEPMAVKHVLKIFACRKELWHAPILLEYWP